MAGKGWRRFTRETLSSADVQGYLMDQAVMRFDSAAQRTTELTLPADGMVSYLEDVDDLEYLEGGGAYWRPVSGTWRNHTQGSLPSTGVRDGDTIYSTVYQCALIYASGGWRQATIVTVASLANYIAGLQSLGVTGLHNGWLVMDSDNNRVFACTGGLVFMQVAGRPLPRVTNGFPTAPSGWSYNASGVTWVRSMGNGMAHLYLEMTKTVAVLNVSVTGEFTNVVIGSVPDAYRPLDTIPLCSGSGGRVATGFLSPNGEVTLAAVAPGAGIVVGEIISLGGSYRLERIDY